MTSRETYLPLVFLRSLCCMRRIIIFYTFSWINIFWFLNQCWNFFFMNETYVFYVVLMSYKTFIVPTSKPPTTLAHHVTTLPSVSVSNARWLIHKLGFPRLFVSSSTAFISESKYLNNLSFSLLLLISVFSAQGEPPKWALKRL